MENKWTPTQIDDSISTMYINLVSAQVSSGEKKGMYTTKNPLICPRTTHTLTITHLSNINNPQKNINYYNHNNTINETKYTNSTGNKRTT